MVSISKKECPMERLLVWMRKPMKPCKQRSLALSKKMKPKMRKKNPMKKDCPQVLRLLLVSVHWRRVSWQAGARFFLEHLVDADPASNNLSWQWIASTFSNKPYIFNLENVAKYCGPDINTIPRHNLVLDQSYERLSELLFPYMGGPHG